jgi:hypothetical protein
MRSPLIGILCAAIHLSACSSRLAPTDVEDFVMTPAGALAIYPHTFGRVLPWHVDTAEASWHHVAACLRLNPAVLCAFPVYLVARPMRCGDLETPGCTILDANPRIEIIGASWDFDPAHPDLTPGSTAEIARLWRHELVHVALWKRDGDLDANHEKQEWECER